MAENPNSGGDASLIGVGEHAQRFCRRDECAKCIKEKVRLMRRVSMRKECGVLLEVQRQ